MHRSTELLPPAETCDDAERENLPVGRFFFYIFFDFLLFMVYIIICTLALEDDEC